MFFVAAFTVGMTSAVAQERDDPKFSSKAESKAKNLKRQIQEEIGHRKNHEWAGEYYEGDGLGENVTFTIAPKHGYVFEWRGCLGVYDRNYGSVTITNSRILLSFAFTNKQEEFAGVANEFMLIPWGDRKYVVPANDVVGFCNDVNSGREPRKQAYGRYLLRRGDEAKKVSGNPTVPSKFQTCLLKEPIEASITRILKTSTRPSRADFQFNDATVAINAGKKQGLRPGMELYVTDPDRLVETVTVLSVVEDASEGIITQTDKDDPTPQVGWKLSTSPPWRAAFRR